MARRSMTYGVMPAREEFDAACAEPDDESGKSVDDLGFSFGNDPRIGSDTLTGAELWNELEKAHGRVRSSLRSSRRLPSTEHSDGCRARRAARTVFGLDIFRVNVRPGGS